MSKSRILIIILFAAASLVRLADAFRPIDKGSWRENDLGAISRNFALEGMNPLYPRIDWRGDGPGYAEMEAPIYPFLTAVTYKIFGIHDEFGRMWAFLFSICALFFFYRLAREYLDLFPAIVAFAFFAFNPLIVLMATAIQPEALMLFAYIAAVYFFIRWLKHSQNSDFWPAVLMTALTLLAKAPSVHIGLFFGILVIEKYGWKVVRQGKVWLFSVLSVLPAVLWYVHANNLWKTYGNSLGVSNEYHWIGWDFFTDTGFVSGILRSEFLYVWVVFGLIVGAFAVWRGYREETSRHSLGWLASIFALYLLAARTTSEDWANYYHVFSVPPVALIFGLGIKKLWDYARESADTFSRHSLPVNLGKLIIILAVITAVAATLLFELKQVRSNLLNHRVIEPAFACAAKIKPLLKTDGLIVASGEHCVDKKGYILAYNASYMFYWLERKGWNICIEEQSIEKISDFAALGAKYFIAQKSYLTEKPGFEDELRQNYRVVAECEDYLLFDLTSDK